jgi:predicted unusual protein kinase regulating ubiquinone biosynthesis (AarF/ABC1/UbiB family)
VSEDGLPADVEEGKHKGDGISQGRLRRVAPIAGLSARTAGEAVIVGLRSKLTGADSTEFHIRTAERYFELFGRSKGALMKTGQLLSFFSLGPTVPDGLQTIYQAALVGLCEDVPPMAPELAREVLERELGRPTEDAFAEFDWQPLAAASIGQVHAARLHDGRAVAVKIQYPGVAAAIRADLKNAELLVTFLGFVLGLSKVKFDLEEAAQEFSVRILEELDYRLEAVNQAEFAELYRGHPFIHVPDVLVELSTDRVLTQELVQGKSWSEAQLAEQELRDKWGETIFRFFYDSFQRGVGNVDPHPGNYLFHDDGTVSFLDFGCVKRYPPEQVEAMHAIVHACVHGDVTGTWRANVEGGFFSATDPVSPEEIFDYWRVPSQQYWGEQPFTVTPEHVAAHIERRYGPTGPSSNAYRHMTVPRDLVVMSRAEIEVWSVIGGLRPSVYWGSITDEQFEDKPPFTALGKLDRAFFEQREAAEGHV